MPVLASRAERVTRVSEVDLMTEYPREKRSTVNAGAKPTHANRRAAQEFGAEYFDGNPACGYGGYRYHPRFWKETVRRFRDYYRLAEDAQVLDVGCAKGFMIRDFAELMPHIRIHGVDISDYALTNADPLAKGRLIRGSAEAIPFHDESFDLVVAIKSVDLLPNYACRKALQEIQRVSRGHSYVVLRAYRDQDERVVQEELNLAARTLLHVDEWKELFSEVGYAGDYSWNVLR